MTLDSLQAAHQQGSLLSKNLLYPIFQRCIQYNHLFLGRRAFRLLISTGMSSLCLLDDLVIRLFATCGSLEEAKLVFCRSHDASMSAWHAIVSAHLEHGDDCTALELCGRMLERGIEPDRVAFFTILKICANLGCIDGGRFVHDCVVRRESELQNAVGSCLVNMYAKCGSLVDAEMVLTRLPTGDVVAWSSLIAAYVNRGLCSIALNKFEIMISLGIYPDKFILSSITKACGVEDALWMGRIVHACILENTLESNVIVSTALIDMYCKCRIMLEALFIFDKLPIKHVASWNVLIAGYVQHGDSVLALQLFQKMEANNVKTNEITFVSVLKASAYIMALKDGRTIHDRLIRNGLKSNVQIQNALFDMYANCADSSEVLKMFNGASLIDTTSCNVMIVAFLEHGEDCLALDVFQAMEERRIEKDEFTFSCMLKACSQMIDTVEEGRIIHNQMVCQGFKSDLMMESSLVSMYARCGYLQDAYKIIQNMVTFDVIAWNGLISGHAQHGYSTNVFLLIEEMQRTGIEPNRITFVSILKACKNMDSVLHGRLMHDELIRHGFETHEVIANALVDIYADFGNFYEAFNLFGQLLRPNVIAWNAMIAACVEYHYDFTALQLFWRMHQEGIDADNVTYMCSLQACSSVCTLAQGRLIHDRIIRSGLENDIVVGTKLIEMYARCGNPSEGHHLFDRLTTRDVVTWNALIAGYAYFGHQDLVIGCMREMHKEGLEPDSVMCITILMAYCHSGHVLEGHWLLNFMKGKCGLMPNHEHLECMVDTLTSTGFLNESRKLLATIPIPADSCSWMHLMKACEAYSNAEVGRECFGKIFVNDPTAMVTHYDACQ